jgi:hypothetical protein
VVDSSCGDNSMDFLMEEGERYIVLGRVVAPRAVFGTVLAVVNMAPFSICSS